MGKGHASVMGQLGAENLFHQPSLGIRPSGLLHPLLSGLSISEVAIKVSLKVSFQRVALALLQGPITPRHLHPGTELLPLDEK